MRIWGIAGVIEMMEEQEHANPRPVDVGPVRYGTNRAVVARL